MLEIGILVLLALHSVLAYRYLNGPKHQNNESPGTPDAGDKPVPVTRHRLDEYHALCKRYNLPAGATDADISRAIDNAFQAGRRRNYGLPPETPEAELRKYVARDYGLPETCSDAELSAAIDKRFQAGRRRSAGLPVTASEAEVRAHTARDYGLPETCSDAELSAAIDKRFRDGYRRGLGLEPTAD